jgi:hypothetical protein
MDAVSFSMQLSFGCQYNVFPASTIVGCDFNQVLKKNFGEHDLLQIYSKNGPTGVVL